MDPLTRKLVETVRHITEAAPDAPHRNPVIQAAAEFLHQELGPLSRVSDSDHPWHYSNRISMALKNPATASVDQVLQAAREHVITGHHGTGRYAYQNLDPMKVQANKDEPAELERAGEDHLYNRLEDHLQGSQKNR